MIRTCFFAAGVFSLYFVTMRGTISLHEPNMSTQPRSEPKRVAAIVTEYRRWSHADVIVSKILEGYSHDRRNFPNLRLVSMYVDQFPANDMSRALAKQHGFTARDV